MTKYHVTTISKHAPNDEWAEVTEDKTEAIRIALDEIYRCDPERYRVEVRVYKEDVGHDECTCFDYDTIEVEKGDLA